MASKQFQPMMSKVSPTINIQQGVVDNSEAVRIQADTAQIGQLGKMALDANKGYELARLEKRQEGVINDFMQPRLDAVEAAGIRTVIDSMWDKSENDQATMEAVNPLEQQFKERLDRYKKAQEQGIMSPQEFQMRIMKETREAVNRLPGIFPELIEHSKKVLQLSGINDIIQVEQTFREQQAKQASDAAKNLRELADKLNVSYNAANPNYGQMQQGVHAAQAQLRASATITALKDQNAFVSQEQARAFVANEGSNLVVGDVRQLQQSFGTLFQNATPKDYDSLVTQLEMQVIDRKKGLAVLAGSKGILNEGATKELIKAHTEALDQVLATVKASGSGKNAFEAMNNAAQRLDSEHKYKFAQQYDTASLNAFKLIPDPVWQKWSLQGDGNITKLMGLTSSLMNNFTNSPAMREALTSTVTKPGVVDAVAVPFSLLDAGQVEPFNKSVSTLRKAISETANFKTEEEKFKVMDGFMKELSSVSRKGKFVGMGDVAIGDVFNISDEYVNTTTKFMAKKAVEFGDVFADFNGGKLIFTSPNSAHAAYMNKEYASRFNTSVAAHANVLNVSNEQAAATLFPRYQHLFTPTKTGNSVQTSRFGTADKPWWKQ